MRSWRYNIALHMCGVGLVLACGSDGPGFPDNVVFEGEYLTYFTSTKADTKICTGAYHVQNAYVGALAELLSVDLDAPVKYAMIAPEEGDYYCSHGKDAGCYYDGKAFSVKPVQYHELAHAVADAGGYHGPLAFQEGFAEVFGNGMNLDEPRTDLRGVLEEWTGDDSGYYTMALFVRYLIEEYGLEQLLAFMEVTDRNDPYDEFSSAFSEIFDKSLEDVTAEFAEYPSCSRWENRYSFFECSMTPEPWANDNEWRVTVDIDCTDDDVLGTLGEKDVRVMWVERALVIGSAANYVVWPGGQADEWGQIRLTKCDSCWDPLDLQFSPGAEPVEIFLPAGQYHVLFAKYVSEPGQTGLVLQRVP